MRSTLVTRTETTMPATLTRAPDFKQLMAFYQPRANDRTAEVMSPCPKAVCNLERLQHRSLAAPSVPGGIERERDERWQYVVEGLRAHPRYLAQACRDAPVFASSASPGRLYPSLSMELLLERYPQLADCQCDDSLPRRPMRADDADSRLSRMSRGFQYAPPQPAVPARQGAFTPLVTARP